MSNFLNLLLALLIVPANFAFAHTPEEGKITALIGPFVYRTNFGATSPGLESPLLSSFGLIAEGDISSRGGFEIALFPIKKIFFRQEGGSFEVEEIKLIYITMGYRRWWNSRFSTALTLFSSYTMGDYSIVHSDFAPSKRIDTSAQDVTEYGFDFSLQYEFWSQGHLAAVMDARYSLSVTSKDHEDADHFGALIGLRFLVQEK